VRPWPPSRRPATIAHRFGATLLDLAFHNIITNTARPSTACASNRTPQVQEHGTIITARPHGFAFIKPDAPGPDVFVSAAEISRAGFDSLTRGQRVTFDVVQDRYHNRGPRAVRIAVVGDGQ
jgi:cold shock CspA family protein